MDTALKHAIDRVAASFKQANGDAGSMASAAVCDEADDLAVVLALAGHIDAAAIAIALHAEADDCEQHGAIGAECERQVRLGVSPAEGRSLALAGAYVTDMVEALTAEVGC